MSDKMVRSERSKNKQTSIHFYTVPRTVYVEKKMRADRPTHSIETARYHTVFNKHSDIKTPIATD